MIILDTHIWVWWVDGGERLTEGQWEHITTNQPTGVGVCAISVWELAKLVERGRLKLALDVDDWCRHALTYPGVMLLPLTPEIAIESTRLGGEFHKDPADQIIVATARVLNVSLVTADERILRYPHVSLAT